jgi:hypothetical protein
LSDYAAHRAAGQSIAALWRCVTISRAGINGIVVIWAEPPGRCHVMADIAIWLTGVAGVDGWTPGLV